MNFVDSNIKINVFILFYLVLPRRAIIWYTYVKVSWKIIKKRIHLKLVIGSTVRRTRARGQKTRQNGLRPRQRARHGEAAKKKKKKTPRTPSVLPSRHGGRVPAERVRRALSRPRGAACINFHLLRENSDVRRVINARMWRESTSSGNVYVNAKKKKNRSVRRARTAGGTTVIFTSV